MRFPLFIVTGAAGTGKSEIVEPLRRRLPGVAVLDKDHMWAQDWGQAYDNFFRIANGLAQSRIHTVVVGTIIPEHFVGFGCTERDLVGDLEWINLHCSDEERERRLGARPSWRSTSTPDGIREHRDLAARLLAGELPAETPSVDTTSAPVEEVAEVVASLIERRIRLFRPDSALH